MGQQIYLNNHQSALVIGDDGCHALHIHKLDDDAIVSHYVTLLTTIGILLKNDDLEFQAYLAKRWNEIVMEMPDEEILEVMAEK